MKLVLASAILIGLSTAVGWAAGTHSGGHEGMIDIGKPGEKSKAKRTVNIVMRDKDDGSMVFEPTSLQVRKGETLRLRFLNKGEQDHEFVMDTETTIMEHKETMAKFPEMEHDDPNAIQLEAGASGEIVWTFANAGEFKFACLIPGHYEAGMKGNIQVAK